MLSDERLEQIRRRDRERTPGRWVGARDHLGHWRVTWERSQNSSVLRGQKVFADEDIDFICGCSEDVPALLAEVDRLRARVAEMEASK